MDLLAFLEKANERLERPLFWVTGLALVLSTFLTFLGVILRYLFGISFEWNEELCRYGMILIVYLYAGALIKPKQHIYFSLFSDRAGGRAQDLHGFLVSLLTLLVGIPVTLWGVGLAYSTYEAELRTLSLLFPLWPAYALIPLGMIFIVLHGVLEALRLGIRLFSRAPSPSI